MRLSRALIALLAGVPTAAALSAGDPSARPSPASQFRDPLRGTAKLVVTPTIVGAAAREARVRITLAEPLLRQVTFRYEAQNGSGPTAARSGYHFLPTKGVVAFRPGETERIVAVPLKRALGNKEFKLVVGWTFDVPTIPGATYPVRGGDARTATPPSPPRSSVYTGPQLKEGRTLVYETDFKSLEGWTFRPGLRLNGEAAVYSADPANYPLINGTRALRIIRTADGGFSAPMITTDKFLRQRGGYFELDATIPKGVQGVPAFWSRGVTWPRDGEIDAFEMNLGGNGRMTVSFHYVDERGRKRASNQGTGFVPDGKRHLYAYAWDEQWTTFLVDGREVGRIATPTSAWASPAGHYLLISATAGGLAPTPNVPIGWTEDMLVHGFRAYR
jgi:hypothetical protein